MTWELCVLTLQQVVAISLSWHTLYLYRYNRLHCKLTLAYPPCRRLPGQPFGFHLLRLWQLHGLGRLPFQTPTY
jgi:hypothetical protein